jgi:hypothetical protein
MSGIIVGMCFTFAFTTNSIQTDAIKHNVGYYHPITKDFTWKTNLVEINK